MRAVVASCLVVEVVVTGSWLASALPMLPVYGWATLLMIAARVIATASQSAAIYGLVEHNTTGPDLSATAFLTSAVVLTLELGTRLAPSNVFPSHRWPIVGMYWLYALAGTLLSRRLQTRP
jgi:hypothetical protein